MRRPWLMLLCGLLTGAPAAVAASPDLDALLGEAGYGVEQWTVEDGLPVNAVANLLVSRDGYLWIATFDGLARFDGVRFTVFDTATVPELGSNRIVHLFEDDDGALLIQDERGRLVRLHGGTFRRVTSPELEGKPGVLRTEVRRHADGAVWVMELDSLYRNGRRLLRARSSFSCFIFDPEGNVWAGTVSDGIFVVRRQRLRVLGVAHGLPEKNVLALQQDRDGRLWVITRDAPLTVVDGASVRQLSCSPLTVYDDPLHGVLFGSDGLYEPAGVGCRQLLHARVTVYAIYRTRGGRLAAGTNEGLLLSEPEAAPDATASFQHLRQVDGTALGIVRAIHESADGSLWLGTNGSGVVRWREGGDTRRLTRADGLPSDLVRAFHEDRDGHLWIATEDRGLARLDPASLDRGEEIAIATVDRGDGLFDNSLHQVLEDDDGWLWISSNRGIFRVRRDALNAFLDAPPDGPRPRFDTVYYNERDGMRNREANGGFADAGLRSADGTLYFATQDGVVVVEPEKLTRRLPSPLVVIERLLVAGREVDLRGGGVTLAPDERSFRVEYTGLSFRAPERLRFRYRLEGYDDGWQDADERRTTNYTLLPPGRYTFRVLARSADGVWSPRAASVGLVVEPYVHETLVFRVVCGLAVVAIGGLAVRLRNRHERRRRRELERLVAERTREVSEQAAKLAELDQAKTELYTNISHEFRTPLTLTLGPLHDLRSGRYGSLEAAAVRVVDKARANAARVLALINQLLDVARVDAGGLTLRVAEDDLAGYVELLAGRFVALAECRRLDFSVTTPEEEVWVYFDPEQLDKVLTNLLSNAFKFTRPGGRVEVTVTAPRDGRVEVAVRDTGRGIAAADLPRLFDRFYQVRGSERRRYPGSGLGLTLCRDLVELHGGTLEVTSTPGEGSAFTVRLRTGRGHFSDEQVVRTEETQGATTLGTTTGSLSADRVFAVEAMLAEIEVEPTAVGGRASGATADTDEDRTADGERRPDEADETDRTTVLVVDDHPDLRAYVRSHLEESYRVVEAGDGAAGLAQARRHLPDVVVSDVMMPEMDGFELCRNLREDPELDWIPLILLTAKATAQAKLEGLGIGADDYLTKPFDVRELVLRVDNLIASRQRLRDRFLAEIPAGGAEPPVHELPFEDPPAATSDDERFLARVAESIDAGLVDEEFDVEALARAVAMSRTQLFVRLKELTGEPPSRLLLERRLERGAALLRDGVGQVSEVAYAVGFKSVAHFSRHFRARFDTTPSAFRRAAAEA